MDLDIMFWRAGGDEWSQNKKSRTGEPERKMMGRILTLHRDD